MAIIQRKNKRDRVSFQVKVRDSRGQWYPTATFKKIEEAKLEEARLLGLRLKYARIFIDDGRKTSVEDYYSVWGVDRRSGVSAGWIVSQDQMFRDYVLPVIGPKKMAEIDKPLVGDVLNRMRRMGRGEQMVDHVYALLRRMFSDAVEYYEMIEVSPVSPKHHKPKVVVTERKYLRPEESFKLLGYAQDHVSGPLLWLELLAGLRTEAAVALNWDSVMWKEGQLLIRRAWKKKTKTLADYPKGKAWKYVPLVPMLKGYLEALWIRRGKPTEGFVCLSEQGKMYSPHTWAKQLPRLCREAGVRCVSPHELRHSCSELFVEQGASLEDLRRLYNHEDAKTTLRYVHRTDERLAEIASRVGVSTRPKDLESCSQIVFPNGNKEAECLSDRKSDVMH